MYGLSVQRTLAGATILMLVGLAVAVGTGRLGTNAAANSDVAAVKLAVQNGLQLMGEACLEGNHDAVETYKARLTEYWSDASPSGSLLATRSAIATRLFPVPDATELVLGRESAIARATAGEISAEELTPVASPAPDWFATDSILTDQENALDYCQGVDVDYPMNRPTEFAITNIVWESVAIDGQEATVEASITMETSYDERVASATYAEYVTLAKESGTWRITSEVADNLDGWP